MQTLPFKKCACEHVHEQTDVTLTYLDGLYVKVPLLQRHGMSEGSFQPDIQNQVVYNAQPFTANTALYPDKFRKQIINIVLEFFIREFDSPEAPVVLVVTSVEHSMALKSSQPKTLMALEGLVQ